MSMTMSASPLPMEEVGVVTSARVLPPASASHSGKRSCPPPVAGAGCVPGPSLASGAVGVHCCNPNFRKFEKKQCKRARGGAEDNDVNIDDEDGEY